MFKMSILIGSHYDHAEENMIGAEKSFIDKAKEKYATLRKNAAVASSTIKDTTCKSDIEQMMENWIEEALKNNGELTVKQVNDIAHAALKQFSGALKGCGDRESEVIKLVLSKENNNKVHLYDIFLIDYKLRKQGFKKSVRSPEEQSSS